jgi:hypothetical protein
VGDMPRTLPLLVFVWLAALEVGDYVETHLEPAKIKDYHSRSLDPIHADSSTNLLSLRFGRRCRISSRVASAPCDVQVSHCGTRLSKRFSW